MNVRLRNASPDDAEALLAIYGYYVENTAISFEYDTPSAEVAKFEGCGKKFGRYYNLIFMEKRYK